MFVLLLAGCPDEVDPCGIPGHVCTVVGSGDFGFDGDGLPGEATALYWPTTVRIAPDGRVVFADMNNNRIRALEPDGTVVTIVGNGVHVQSVDGLAATDTAIDYPIDFRFLPDGSFYVAGLHEARIVHVDSDGILRHYAGTGEYGYSGDGGPAIDAMMGEPAGIALAADGTLYVSDSYNHCIRAIAPDGTISTVAGHGVPSPEVSRPSGLELIDGVLYYADAGNNAVRGVVLATGATVTVAGTGAGGFTGDGLATDVALYDPSGLTAGPDGTLWVLDSYNNRVRRLQDDVLVTVAGSGEYVSDGDGGPAGEASFAYPRGATFDAEGNLYVAEMLGPKIRRIAAW